MKKYKSHIITILLFAVVIFLYGFASERSAKKKMQKIDVVFENGENLFITYEMVNKLLIQNLENQENQSVESLLLNKLEMAVESNPMIQNAEVFYTLQGHLGAIITQKTPVLRVVNESESFYLDVFGKKMPLSGNYSSRVPIISNLDIKDAEGDLTLLANKIKNDPFLQKQIIGIKQKKGEIKQFELYTRVGGQTIVLGSMHNFEKKKSKLKAFYQDAIANHILEKYDTINLSFDNQIVCSKK
ncbi:cell division protein FtsQ/DivIB [Namhaeicola litoreus]|uniref:Cell division protein FtsQ/DivIB n=1 Tax=Namhaeicola litoreus TaxID=1052145 RepID=A0ABW3XZL5_9FLAO